MSVSFSSCGIKRPCRSCSLVNGEALRKGASSLNASQQALVKKHRPAQTIGSFGRDTAASVNNNATFTREQLLQGRFIPQDEKDTDMKLLKDVQNNENRTPFGTVSVDPKMLIDYYKTKKNQKDYTELLELGSLMIDEKDPSSQKRAYSVLPELEKIPEAFFQEQFAFQASIYQMLRDGQVRGREDLETLKFLLRKDVMLPLTPLWDLNGFIIKSIEGTKDWKAFQLAKTQKGYFNPFKWTADSLDNTVPQALQKVQLLAKTVILKRLLPGLRNIPDTDEGNDELKKKVLRLMNAANKLGSNDLTVPDDIGAELNDLVQ